MWILIVQLKLPSVQFLKGRYSNPDWLVHIILFHLLGGTMHFELPVKDCLIHATQRPVTGPPLTDARSGSIVTWWLFPVARQLAIPYIRLAFGASQPTGQRQASLI